MTSNQTQSAAAMATFTAGPARATHSSLARVIRHPFQACNATYRKQSDVLCSNAITVLPSMRGPTHAIGRNRTSPTLKAALARTTCWLLPSIRPESTIHAIKIANVK